MLGRFEQRLFAWLPIFGHFAFWWLKHTAIDQALCIQFGNRLFNQASAIKRLFGKEVIHCDVQLGQIFADQVHHRGGRKFTDFFKPELFAFVDELVTDFFFQRFTHWNQIISGVCAIGEFNILTVGLQIPQVHRPCENVDLRAAIVDVVFFGNVVARVIQQPRQRIAKYSATCVANV